MLVILPIIKQWFVISSRMSQTMNSMAVSLSSGLSINRPDPCSDNFSMVLTNDEGRNDGSTSDEVTHSGLSSFHTIISVIKCAVGAGSFTLPRSFYACGLISSCILTFLIGSISCCTLCMLVRSEDLLRIRGETVSPSCHGNDDIEITENAEQHDSSKGSPGHKPIKYTDLGSMAFPSCTINYCGSTKNIVEQTIFAGILMTSLGVCAAYVDFIAGTLPEVLGPWLGWIPSRAIVTLACLPVILFLSYLPDFKSLVWTSMLGDLAVLSGCVAVVAYGAMHSGPAPLHALPWKHAVVNTELSAVAEFIGSAGFLFTVHIAVFPIFQQMKRPHGACGEAGGGVRDGVVGGGRRRGSTGESRSGSKSGSGSEDMIHCAVVAFGVLTVFNIVFGCVGGLLYAHMDCEGPDQTGASTSARQNGPCTNVLSNIRSGPVLGLVKALICVDLLFTIPLVLTAGREIVEAVVLDLIPQGNEKGQAGDLGDAEGGLQQVHAASSSSSSRPSVLELVDFSSRTGPGAAEREQAVVNPLMGSKPEDQHHRHHRGDVNAIGVRSLDLPQHQQLSGDGKEIESKEKGDAASGKEDKEFVDDAQACRQGLMSGHTIFSHSMSHSDAHAASVSVSVPVPVRASDAAIGGVKSSPIGDPELGPNPADLGSVTTRRALRCCSARRAVRYAVRSVLVLVVIGVALGIPHFGDMVDLIGGTMGPVLCYLIPAAIHLRARAWEGAGPLSLWGAALHGGIVAFGLLTLLVSTYFTVLSMTRQ